MAEIIGVRFKDVGKIYYFDPSGLKIQKGSHVVELKYDYSSRIIGLIISLAGILLTVAIYIIWRRRRVR